jgi:hypothetical protein
MKRFLPIVMLVLGGLPSAQAFCDEEDIDTVGDGGRIIVLLDGSVWKSLDPATSATWLSSETVLICDDDKMINKDEDGDTVDVVRLH